MHEFVTSAIIEPVKRILMNNLGVEDLFYLFIFKSNRWFYSNTWKDYIAASWCFQVKKGWETSSFSFIDHYFLKGNIKNNAMTYYLILYVFI